VRQPLTPGRKAVAVLAVTAVAAGGTLLALGLRKPAAEAVWADAVPVAVARPSTAKPTAAAGGGTQATAAGKSYVGGVRLASYSASTGTALLATEGGKAATVQTGDVIASPPSKAAPNGALFTVAKTTKTAAGTKVTTAPATLSDALGATVVDRTFPAEDLTMTVKTLAAGVKPVAGTPALSGSGTATTTSSASPSASPSVSSSPTASASPGGAALPSLAVGGTTILNPTRTADGGLLLSLNIPLTGVAGITGTSKGGPTLAGWVGLTPKLVFSYGQKSVDGAKPFQAEIGVGGKYTYGWQVHAALAGLADTGEKAISLPFATVHLSQTFWIGPVPVVLSVDLTYFYRLTASGDLSIDSEQTTTGEFAVGAAYDSRTGWGPLNRNSATTQGDAVPVVTGKGDLRATVGADLSVFLYDSAGVTGRLAPYLRAAVDASAAPIRWGVYTGFDVTATLTLQLKIFGITILKADLPIPPIHAEWKVAASNPEPAVPATS
jgi:hypothetical protein